jgi:hypothetical protein
VRNADEPQGHYTCRDQDSDFTRFDFHDAQFFPNFTAKVKLHTQFNEELIKQASKS